MTKNLDVDHYRNGDLIPKARDSIEWSNLKSGAWCYYNNDSAVGKVYGKLYNWYAFNDPRGLAPSGWHVPSFVDSRDLEMCLGGYMVAGWAMKVTDSSIWKAPDFGVSDNGLFSALPGGSRGISGKFSSLGYGAGWWLLEESILDNTVYFMYIYNNSSALSFQPVRKGCGLSVRCVKD